jgi:hypothetical protein
MRISDYFVTDVVVVAMVMSVIIVLVVDMITKFTVHFLVITVPKAASVHCLL